MNSKKGLLQDNANDEATVFDWIIAGLMVFGAIIAAITLYLLLFNPDSALAKKLPKVSVPSIVDYIFICLHIIVGLMTAIYVFIFKKKVITGFIIGFGINGMAYLYQMLFRNTIERNICEYIIPYSMGPILIIIIFVNLVGVKNKRI